VWLNHSRAHSTLVGVILKVCIFTIFDLQKIMYRTKFVDMFIVYNLLLSNYKINTENVATIFLLYFLQKLHNLPY
jgi:hypothetical protein